MKGTSILLIVVILVIIVIGAFWMLRGRSTTEEVLPTLSPVTAPIGGAGVLPATNPTASPVSGLPTTLASPVASPNAPVGKTVSITAKGFSPASVTVPMNGTVTFTNSDTQSHQINSDPHPTHTSYPTLNGDVLAAGKSRTVTFTKAGTFGYHDHLNPGTKGTVTVK